MVFFNTWNRPEPSLRKVEAANHAESLSNDELKEYVKEYTERQHLEEVAEVTAGLARNREFVGRCFECPKYPNHDFRHRAKAGVGYVKVLNERGRDGDEVTVLYVPAALNVRWDWNAHKMHFKGDFEWGRAWVPNPLDVISVPTDYLGAEISIVDWEKRLDEFIAAVKSYSAKDFAEVLKPSF